MTIHEHIKAQTEALEAAIYGALEACDEYRDAVVGHLTAEESAADPNEMVIKRLRQFEQKAAAITRIIEDDVLTELLFCIDRLEMFRQAERGEFF